MLTTSKASQASFTKSRSTCIVRGRGRSRRLAELPMASWWVGLPSLFAEWDSSCALALCAYRGPHLTNSSENKLQQPLAGVLTSQISTFSLENKLQQLHIFFQEWKSRVQWKYGGSTEVDHQLCRLAIVTLLLHTLKMFQPPNSTFSLSGFSYYTTTTHVQKKVRKTI